MSTFINGLVLPLPSPTDVPPTVEQLRLAREWTRANGMRLSMPVGAPLSRIEAVLEAGYSQVLLLFGEKGRKVGPVELGGWVEHVMRYCRSYPDYFLHSIELHAEGPNEPSGNVDQRYEPEELHPLLLAMRDAVRHHGLPGTRLWYPAEIMDCSHGTLKDYGQRMVRLLGPLAEDEGWAVHPYRDPKPWWWSRTRLGSLGYWLEADREAEWLVLQHELGRLDIPILITEVGWRLSDKCTPEQQRDNLRGEVAFWRGIPTCRGMFAYTMHGPANSHGIIDEASWQPRPAATDLFR